MTGLIIAILLIALYGTTLVYMQTGSDTYMDKSTPRGILFDEYNDAFHSDSIFIVFETDSVTGLNVLEYMSRLEDDIRNEQNVAGVSGLVDMVQMANGGALPRSNAEIIAAKEKIPPELLKKYLPSELMAMSVINLDTGTTHDSRNQFLDNLDTLIKNSDIPPGIHVTISGDPAFQKQMGEEIGSETGILIIGAMFLMVIAVGFLFSHVRFRFLPVFVVGSGLLVTFGFMGIAGIPLSMVVIAAFPVLIGIGIDYAIQFQSRFDEEVQKGSLSEAVTNTLTNMGPSVLFAMVATSLGFIAMYISPIPMVGQFGTTCVIGVTSCYLMALLIVPTFGKIIDYKPIARKKDDSEGIMARYDKFLGRLARRIAQHPVSVLLVVGLIAIVGIQLDSTIPISTDEDTFVPPDMPAVVDLKKIQRTMGSTLSLSVIVRGDEMLDSNTISWIDDFGSYEVNKRAEITGVNSIATTLRKYNNGVLPQTPSEISEVLDRVPSDTRDQYLNGNMESLLEFSLVKMNNNVAENTVTGVKDDIRWNYAPPGIYATPTGSLELFTTLIKEIKESKTMMTLLGFFMIFVFLLAVYRRLSAISPIIPIIMIVGWNGAIMYILSIDYTPMTACLGSMTIGVASEYTILIMERFQEERNRGMEILDAIQTSVQKIGTAVTVSGLTTVFGFSALLLSTFNIINDFGKTTVITVAFSVMGAIVVMPAVLSLMGRLEKPKKAESED